VESLVARLPRDGRVAIIRLRSLGDCVLTTPALDILKRCRPDLRIAVVVENRFRAVFENNPDIDEILAPEIAAPRRFRPDLCLNLHGGTRSAWMALASRARWRAGFGHFRNQFAYNVRIPRAQEVLGVERTVHTAEHLASAMFFLGAPICEIPRAKLSRPLPGGVPSGPGSETGATGQAVIHPFASSPSKTWPAERFVEVAQHLPSPVFIGADSDDLSPFAGFRTLQGAPLSELKALLSGASFFLGNDSGPAHMAAAFGVPVVVIFGDSDPAIWGPWRTPSEIVTAPGGIQTVEVSRVIDAITRLRVHA
jgi:heptosyltransferase-3